MYRIYTFIYTADLLITIHTPNQPTTQTRQTFLLRQHNPPKRIPVKSLRSIHHTITITSSFRRRTKTHINFRSVNRHRARSEFPAFLQAPLDAGDAVVGCQLSACADGRVAEDLPRSALDGGHFADGLAWGAGGGTCVDGGEEEGEGCGEEGGEMHG